MTMRRLLPLLLVLWAAPASGATVVAESCSQAHVNAAIASASDGDTISIPAGACTWTETTTINSSATRSKGLKLVGAGTDASTGTRITANYPGSAILVVWLSRTLARFEMSHIRFLQGSDWTNDSEEATWLMVLRGHADTEDSTFRIHHCIFVQHTANIVNSFKVGYLNSSGSPDNGRPYIWGVFDHNTWSGTTSFQAVDVMPINSRDAAGAWVPSGTTSANDGHLAWQDWTVADHSGTWQNVFFEDNTFTSTDWVDSQASMDCSAGGAMVVRRNLFRNNWITNHGADSGFRSCKWMEVYDNLFVLDVVEAGYASPTSVRGGTGVFYGNRFYDGSNTGTGNPYAITGARVWTSPLYMDYYRATDNRGGDAICASVTCAADTVTGCDNDDDASGWICRDQPGAARGSAMTGWAYGYKWETHPVVYWKNYRADTDTLVAASISGSRTGLSTYLAERRDYIDDDSCGSYMEEPICAAFWNATAGQKTGYAAYRYPHVLVGSQATIPARRRVGEE